MAREQIVYEVRREAAPALALASALLVVLAAVSGEHRKEWAQLLLPWWIWLVPAAAAAVLMLDLVLGVRGPRLARSRPVAVALLAVLVVGNLVALAALLHAILSARKLTGGELLLTAAVVWSTNVVAFGLLFWEMAEDGPVARRGARANPDFQFPQDGGSDDWKPQVWDYLYVSLTNSIAFSPTDALPLTVRAKGLMALGSLISVVTVILVAARAVNVLPG